MFEKPANEGRAKPPDVKTFITAAQVQGSQTLKKTMNAQSMPQFPFLDINEEWQQSTFYGHGYNSKDHCEPCK